MAWSAAAVDCLSSAPNVRLVAIGDALEQRLADARANLLDTDVQDRIALTDASCFAGLDAYKRVIHHPDVNLVLLVTPPGFRPLHLAETVAAGKHTFVEKPVCVDPVGYRSVLASAKAARERGLAIVAGTQFRRSNNYIEAIQAIHSGAIGKVLFAQARYCVGDIWYRPREPGMSDAQYQIHNWYHFVWLSGDQIVEQAVHNLDAVNWAMGSPPRLAFGTGARRTRPADSEIYDSMAIDYEYPNGATLSFMCWQQPGKSHVWNRIVGSKGVAEIEPFGVSTIHTHDGQRVLRVDYEGNAYVTEHRDLIASIRGGAPIVEAEEVARSSLTAIMGRMAAYTGEEVTWQFAAEQSQLDLFPADLRLDSALPSAGVAVPGKTKLT